VHNAILADKYEPDVPLDHVSKYHNIIQHEIGATLDLRCGFWQVGIPEFARAAYRFRDASGRLFEMKRLMMGHVASVEIMQILTGVIVGDRTVVEYKHRSPAQVYVWVDGACFAGTRNDVTAALQKAKETAKKLRATFKEPQFEPRLNYDFIGVHWDHQHGTVRLADKTFQKLPEITPEQMSAREVEQLVGRLIFAAGVTQNPLVQYYFAMKWAKRVCHAINVGKIRPDAIVEVPLSVRPQLDKWLKEARSTIKPCFSTPNTSAPVLFTDATLQNYGAVLVLPTNQIYVSGGKFEDGSEQSIAVREAQAVLFALQDFEQHLRSFPLLDLRIDNTTVEACIRRGCARTDVIASVVNQVLKRSKDWNVELQVSRVGSTENPADEGSRNVKLDVRKLERQLATRVPTYQRMGAGRIFSPFVFNKK
jgi:hypothetical protein